jgi:hypothetical protein
LATGDSEVSGIIFMPDLINAFLGEREGTGWQQLRKATVLRGKGKVGVFQEEVSEDDQFAHEDGAGEFFGFAVGEEAQVEGFENWVVA